MDTTFDPPTSPSALPLSGELITNDPNNFVSVNTQSAITDSFSTSQSSTKSG